MNGRADGVYGSMMVFLVLQACLSDKTVVVDVLVGRMRLTGRLYREENATADTPETIPDTDSVNRV
jgi:hypothetical protein